jgi:hypothetical protein
LLGPRTKSGFGDVTASRLTRPVGDARDQPTAKKATARLEKETIFAVRSSYRRS